MKYIVLYINNKNEIISCYGGFNTYDKAIEWATSNMIFNETFKVITLQNVFFNNL